MDKQMLFPGRKSKRKTKYQAYAENRDNNIKYHITYKTTFKPTGHYYIGHHSTHLIDDGYLGSGVNIMKLLEIFDESYFTREIIEYHNTREDSILAEELLITEDTLNDYKCLNKIPGGNFYKQSRHEKNTIQNK